MADQSFTIGAVLKLDDQASAALAKIGAGFHSVTGSASTAQSKMSGFLQTAMATAIGMNFTTVLSSIKNSWEEVIKAAKGENEELREMAEVLMMVAKPGQGWDELKRQASEYKEILEKVAVTTGTSASTLISAFEQMAERSQRPPEEITKLVEQAALAGRVVPSGMSGIVSAMTAVEQGFIRPRNEMVLLIRQSGLMEGSAKQVARNLMAMSTGAGLEKLPKALQEAAKEARNLGENPALVMAEKSISIMAEKAKGVPLTMAQMITSLKESKEQFFEQVGGPIWKSIQDTLMPMLSSLRDYMASNRDEIEKWAKVIGTRVGVWVKAAAEGIQNAFNYLQTHSEDIFSALEKGAKVLTNAVHFIVANKEILFALAMAHVGGGMLSAASKDKGMVAQGVRAVGGIVGGAAKAGIGLFPEAIRGSGEAMVGGSILGLGALALAIGGVALAANQAAKYLDESKGHLFPSATLGEDSTNALAKYFREMHTGANMARQWTAQEESSYQIKKVQMAAYMEQAGYTDEAINKTMRSIEAGWKHHVEMREYFASMERAQVAYEKSLAPSRDPTAIKEQEAAGQAAVTEVGRMYELAAAQSSEQVRNSMFQYIADWIASHGSLQSALLSGGTKLGGTILGVAGLLSGDMEQFKTQLEEAAKKAGITAAGKVTPLVDARGSTFNVKQDFRDEDPDRVAIVFQRDIMRASLSPRQSINSGI